MKWRKVGYVFGFEILRYYLNIRYINYKDMEFFGIYVLESICRVLKCMYLLTLVCVIIEISCNKYVCKFSCNIFMFLVLKVFLRYFFYRV